MNLRNGKRLIIISDEKEQNKKQKNKRAKSSKIDDANPYLPEEVILENILIRLSARDLGKWSCVSKYWYNASILNDSRFASSHFAHNKDKLNLVFNLLNVWTEDLDDNKGYCLSIEEKDSSNNDDVDGYLKILMDITSPSSHELVGYCNGLVCSKLLGSPTVDWGEICIVNPIREETFSFSYLTPTSGGDGFCRHLCHGFCFDSLSQKYKVVFIYTTTSTINGDQEFVCMVLTLGGGGGTDSWRKIVTSTALSGQMVTRLSRTTRRSATHCGADLFWRVTNFMSDDDKMDMLLSFDIHTEKILFIPLPTECSLTGTTKKMRNYQQCLVVDHHLVEWKEYLWVARSQKIMKRHNRRSPLRPSLHGHNHQRGIFCCCGFKVDLFVLKDKVNQVWIKEESFDLQIREKGLLPAPFRCYFDTPTSTVAKTPPTPTRMLSFSDQLFLYWCNGGYLLLYNLQMKYFKVVKCSSSCEKRHWDIFETKMKNGISPERRIGDDDNLKFPYMDYEVHAQAENLVSLKTFIPGGETRKFYSYSDFAESVEEKAPAGMVNTPRELVEFHTFY